MNYRTVSPPLTPRKRLQQLSVQYTYKHLEDKKVLKSKTKSHHVRLISFFLQITYVHSIQ